MISYIRTDSRCKEFSVLTAKLDEELRSRNGTEQAQYDKHNVINDIGTVVIAKEEDKPVGCGCFKEVSEDCAEIKRMYVCPDYRGRGISRLLLKELETWAEQLGFSKVILETGIKQTEAISLYQRSGYQRTENYGPYKGLKNSVCFSKKL